MNKSHIVNKKIAIIGLGYVGLPLAIEFNKFFSIIAFDTNPERINELNLRIDRNNEFNLKKIKNIKDIIFTNEDIDLKICQIYIITVPTPINKRKKPDLSNIFKASKLVGSKLNKNNIIIYESTVYPGVVEEICAPILEKYSGLKFNKDFFCGYSPERINPGDKEHQLNKIVKITSGSTPSTANLVDNLYKKIIKAGTYKASSIKIAEAAKVIENAQRDLNIAFVNELSNIFDKLSLDTNEILKVASTKWNFLNFKPGLVGGHCIGVDPYYLTYKSKLHGYTPKLITAGRIINDSMGTFIAMKLLNYMKIKNIAIKKSKVLIMGFTFKENSKDVRNSKVYDIFTKLIEKKCNVDVFDPIADIESSLSNYNIEFIKKLKNRFYDSIIIAVAHDIFLQLGIKKIKKLVKSRSIIFDVKGLFNKKYTDITL